MARPVARAPPREGPGRCGGAPGAGTRSRAHDRGARRRGGRVLRNVPVLREGEKTMARPFRRPFPAAIFHGTVLLVAWSALGHASAGAGDGVDFHGAVAKALRNNAGVSAAGYGWTAAKKEPQAARGNSLPRLAFEERFVRTNVPAEAFAFKLNQERLLASDFADVRHFNEAPPLNAHTPPLQLH